MYPLKVYRATENVKVKTFFVLTEYVTIITTSDYNVDQYAKVLLSGFCVMSFLIPLFL